MFAPRLRLALTPCSRRCQWLLCGLLILAGLVLTARLTQREQQDAEGLLHQQFAHLAGERFSRLDERFRERQRDLDSVRRFVEGSDGLDHQAFERFVRPLLDGNRAISWAPLLQVDPQQRDAQLQAFSTRAIAEVGSRFQLRELDADGTLRPLQARERYFPLLFSVSRSIAELPLGLDMASSAPREAVLEEALRSDRVSSSAVLRFASGEAQDRLGMLLVVPVHDHPHGRHADSAQEQAPALQGMLFSSISLPQLLRENPAGSARDSLALELYDLDRPDSPPLYRHNQAASAQAQSHDLNVGSHHYRLLARPTAEFIARHPLPPRWRLALPGTAFSLLLGALLFVVLGQHRRAVELVERRTAELQRSRAELQATEERWTLAIDGIGDGVWDWNLESNRVFFSPVWKHLLGYAADELGDTPEE